LLAIVRLSAETGAAVEAQDVRSAERSADRITFAHVHVGTEGTVTDNPSRRRGTKGQGQLSVWGPEPEATPTVPATPKRVPRSRRQFAHINPAMADWARMTANITVEAAAKRLGIKVERLLSWETGTDNPSIPQLRSLAKLYHRPIAAFYLPAPPRNFTVAKDFRRLPDQPPIAYSTALLFAIRVADYRRDVVLALEPETPPVNFVGSATADERGEVLASRARGLLGVSLEDQRAWKDQYAALNGWKNGLEELGVLVFHFSGVDPHEVRGFSLCERVLPVIALNGADAPNGRVFTLIHEMGHLLLGEGGSCDLAELSHPSAPVLPVEAFCNAFAGAMLVPGDALVVDPVVARAAATSTWTDEDLDRLATRFRVSREVLLRRLLTLGRTSLDFYQRWRASLPTEHKQKAKGRPGVAVMAVRDVGKPFARLVIDAYRSNMLTGGDVSELLGIRLRHVPAIEARLAGADMLTGGEQ
jgi:Zn-dependent peptidase ImmA (M78 family)/transcriptional regulator with XRE-family HTH domain